MTAITRPTRDWLRKGPAEELRERIRTFWAARGHEVPNVWPEPIDQRSWALRSTMINGWPPRLASVQEAA